MATTIISGSDKMRARACILDDKSSTNGATKYIIFTMDIEWTRKRDYLTINVGINFQNLYPATRARSPSIEACHHRPKRALVYPANLRSPIAES